MRLTSPGRRAWEGITRRSPAAPTLVAARCGPAAAAAARRPPNRPASLAFVQGLAQAASRAWCPRCGCHRSDGRCARCWRPRRSSRIAASASAAAASPARRAGGGLALDAAPRRFLSKAATKRLPLNSKRARKGYYKGLGANSTGRHTSKGASATSASAASRKRRAQASSSSTRTRSSASSAPPRPAERARVGPGTRRPRRSSRISRASSSSPTSPPPSPRCPTRSPPRSSDDERARARTTTPRRELFAKLSASQSSRGASREFLPGVTVRAAYRDSCSAASAVFGAAQDCCSEDRSRGRTPRGRTRRRAWACRGLRRPRRAARSSRRPPGGRRATPRTGEKPPGRWHAQARGTEASRRRLRLSMIFLRIERGLNAGK